MSVKKVIFMYEYPIWLLLFVFLPLTILWILKFKVLKKYKKVFFLVLLISIIFSYPWNYIALKEKIWYFTESNVIGLGLFGLPIEEWSYTVFTILLISSIAILLWEKYGVKA